ncbi:MAG: lysine--tRNA ligase [Nanoarchaeota archaeon]|nr:lysine--tRNA ligase [Nanoarchaeota archaeon]
MEKFFWADQIAEEIIKRSKRKKIYACASGIGISGTLHIGNFRDAITTDLVVKSLENMGKKVKFIYSWDNYDRFRKVPSNVPKKFEKYIGMPVSEIPSPFSSGKTKSYAEYFEKPFEVSLKKVGVNPKFISQSKMYKNRKYSSLIKLAMDKRKDIAKILNKYRKEPLKENWYPIMIYCEKCKKDFTKILDVKNYEIEYECSCGFKNKFDYRKKGILKLAWRIDWPMRWFYEKLDFEPGGADLGAAGGSMMTSDEIVKKIFGYDSPLHTYYEFIRLKGFGNKISGSLGNALTIDQVLEVYEPEILRYLFVGTKPKTNFNISFDNDIIKIYDEFDSLERKYYENLATPQEKRIYELSKLKITKEKPKKENFRHLITLVQIKKIKDLNKENKIRAEKVSNWIDKYASDDFKFEVQKTINKDVSLSDKQKKSLVELKKILETKKLNEDQLFNEFYNICNSVEIKNNDFFEGAYNVIINRNKGPRLTNLIVSVGKEKIIKLLNQIK